MEVQDFFARRFEALNRGDYASVYASYHCDAPFIAQFGDRGTYLRFARQNLAGIVVKKWRCLGQRRVDDSHVEVILVMEIAADRGSRFLYELALLCYTDDGWRYHSAQKLSSDDYSGAPDQLDFCHFDSAAEKIRF